MATSFAKPKLRDIQDSAAEHGLAAHEEARFFRKDFGADQSRPKSPQHQTGQPEAFAHRHRTPREIYLVIDGNGRVGPRRWAAVGR